jgi:hypothetical protein
MLITIFGALAATTAVQEQPAVQIPSPPAEMRAVVDSWGQCLNEAVEAVPAATAPEAAAPGVVAACALQQRAIGGALEAWIGAANMTAPQQAEVRRRLSTMTVGIEERVVERIRSLRAAPPVPGAVPGR